MKPTHTDTIVDAEPGTVAEEAICGAVHIAESGLVVFRPYGKMIAFANGKKVQRIFKDEPAGKLGEAQGEPVCRVRAERDEAQAHP